ncbi:MAG: flagellar biosynthesis protein FlhF [Lachnospiraceae bacterium]|nr:flagellar biosynthesis protein FlhF [Lachnospiraceae bacterium]
MIIKKFQAKTEAEAVEAAKKELGQSVVIMNVRNMKKKGFFRIFKPALVEITVALEEDAKENAPVLSQVPPKVQETVKPPVLTGAQRLQLAGQQAKREPLIPESLVDRTIPKEPGIIPEEKKEPSEKAIEARLDNLQNLLEKKIQPSADEQEPEEEEKSKEENDETLAFIQLLYNTMIENEVNEKYANQIIDEIEKNSKSNSPIDYVLSNVYQKMILKFEKPSIITPAAKGPKVVFFVGPTGVGKTTTIAKIASRFCVNEKKRVALLTADTYRIAAAEQLRTYANILEVPFRVIYSVEEVEQMMQEFIDYDYILVDTAGHSHNNESQRDNMSQFIHSLDGKAEKEVFLVVSATTKYRDLVNIADTYLGITDYKLIFTKLDETTTLGNLLNLKLHTGAPLSYVTCGQNVPDDIENFNPQKTVKQLLGGKQ